MESFLKTSNAEIFIRGLRSTGSKFSLSRIKKLCEAFGNPQEKYAVAHVAGTNGKGSTCALLECALRNVCGLKVGMYTSPHLIYIGERIQVNREPIKKIRLFSELLEIREVCAQLFDTENLDEYPSFFEFMTCAAFLDFAREGVDAAVIEVGLGGRLDSTNIVKPDVCAITSIGLDHTDLLGDTLGKIAREKAGIIKSGVDVIIGKLPSEAEREIRCVSDKVGANLIAVSSLNNLPTSALEGGFQRTNAGVALLALRSLGKKGGIFEPLKDEHKVLESFGKVSWRARWETIPLSGKCRLILDASHNPEGAAALDENLRALLSKNGGIKPVITVGVLGEMRAKALLPVIARYASKIFLFVPNEERALSYRQLRSHIPSEFPRECIVDSRVGDVFSSHYKCSIIGEGETIVSTGSIYLAGEILSALGEGVADNMSDKI